jgi:Holliday junction resolvase RusA-like endonuclease
VAEVALMRLGRSWSLDGVYRLTVLAVLANRRRLDGSNVLKAVEDALNGIAYHDDSQVMETSARKLIEPRGHERTEVLLERIGDAPARKTRR